MTKKKKICIIGLGYIGLPMAAILANKGYYIHGVDVNQKKIQIINRGDTHIVEPDLDKLVKKAVNNNYLTAHSEPTEADVFIIAVPTPFHIDKNNISVNPAPNLDYILNATKKIAAYIKSGNLIILESTSPVGTTEMISELLKNEGVDVEKIFVAHSPERVLPGQILKELVNNDRVVGGINKNSTKKAAKFYNKFIEGKIFETDSRTAEMIKLTENSYRDVNIAFANELSMLCHDKDINVNEVIKLANRHPRVNILNPGCGVGGHCISVDPWFLVHSANGAANLIEQARKTNDLKADWVIELIMIKVTEFKEKNNILPTVTCMGLTYKPNIDDLRESPALYITQSLNTKLKVVAVEPNIDTYDSIKLVDIKTGLESDICVYLVPHKEFSNISFRNQDLVFY